MNPHQKYGKMVIASGEDVPFVYEPSSHHTLESFKKRMNRRFAEARKDQSAFVAEEIRSNGSVNTRRLPPPVIHLRDESGFGEATIPAQFDDLPLDEYEQAMGG